MLALKGTGIIILGIVATFSIFLIPTFADTNNKIPPWIKDIAKFWSDNQISDAEYLQSITYLINNQIILIPELESLKLENENLKSQLTETYSETIHEVSDNLTITLHTNKSVYGPNDTIMIFGTVSKIIPEHEVGIVISDPSGKILAVAKIKPNVDGSYGFVAQDPVFREHGQYSVNVYYGGKAFSHTTYTYTPGLQ
ncbi:MAG: hypothetical protein R3327_07975 [Nitrosopumilaceae archaeon]|nr:hypothetical protein [Nitrosopumilaceae archaeon]